MIRVETVQDFVTHQHEAYAACPECQKHHDIDLGRLLSKGLGNRPVTGLRIRCAPCSDKAGRTVLVKVMIAGQRVRGGAAR